MSDTRTKDILTPERLKSTRWSAEHAKREGYTIVPVATEELLALLDLADECLATRRAIAAGERLQ